MSRPAAAPLPPEETTRLTDFARACKAAARVVALYPATHPAIQSSLARIAESAGRLLESGAVRVNVLPDALMLNDLAPDKPDSSVQELAVMLHGHLIGEMTLLDAMPPETWHTFLGLIARSPDEVRGQGGIVRAWMAAGGGPIELRQIDYGDVLRERTGALASDWDEIVANYLEGEFSDLDDKAMAALLDIAGDTTRFREFAERLVAQAEESGKRGKKDLVLLILQALADYVARIHPGQLDRVLTQIAGVLPKMTPEMVITLITNGRSFAKTMPESVRTPSSQPGLLATTVSGGSPRGRYRSLGKLRILKRSSVAGRSTTFPRYSASSSAASSRGVAVFSRPSRAASRSSIRRRKRVSLRPRPASRAFTSSMPSRPMRTLVAALSLTVTMKAARSRLVRREVPAVKPASAGLSSTRSVASTV